MRLTNLLQLGLNLADSVVLETFDFLESVLDNAKRLRVNACGRCDLVDLSVLRLQRLLNRLKLLLQNQVAQSGLLVDFVDDLVELVKQLVALHLEVLELLQFYLVLPFFLLELRRDLSDVLLLLFQLFLNRVMLFLSFFELFDLLRCLGERLLHLLVLVVLTHFLFDCPDVLSACLVQLNFQGLDQVHVDARDLRVVLFDLFILAFVVSDQSLNALVLFVLDSVDFVLALVLHLAAQQLHLVLVLHLDLVENALILSPDA